MNSDMNPDLYIVLRNTTVNGVLVERERYIANFSKHQHAEAFVLHANGVLANADKELNGIEVLYFLKGVEAA
jgi:hypothetical protein